MVVVVEGLLVGAPLGPRAATSRGWIYETPDGLSIVSYVCGVGDLLRIPDLLGRLRYWVCRLSCLRWWSVPCSLCWLCLLYRGDRAGTILVSGREGAVPRDEDTLVLLRRRRRR